MVVAFYSASRLPAQLHRSFRESGSCLLQRALLTYIPRMCYVALTAASCPIAACG